MSVSLDGVSFLPETEGPEYIAPGDKVNLGKDSFLKLLVAQMQNQDPLNPQSNEEFIAQLSQFTQVEQLMNINQGFEGLYMAMNSINNNSMTQMLGNRVVAVGNQFYHNGEDPIELQYNAAETAQTTTLTVYDEAGSVVWSGAVEPVTQGEGTYKWNGLDSNGQPIPEGTYTFSFEASGSDGEPIEVTEMLTGIVDGMSFIDGVPTPSIGDIEFDLSSIIRVEKAE